MVDANYVLSTLTAVAGAPCIVSVAIVDPNDKSTWKIVYTDTATEAQMVAAGEALAALNPAVPSSVSPRQARLALNAAGKRAAVDAAVNAATQDIKDWWEFASVVERQHPVLLQMATSLGWTSSDLDTLFIAAAQLT